MNVTLVWVLNLQYLYGKKYIHYLDIPVELALCLTDTNQNISTDLFHKLVFVTYPNFIEIAFVLPTVWSMIAGNRKSSFVIRIFLAIFAKIFKIDIIDI